MSKEQEKMSTKEKILNAAFGLFKDCCRNDISLSEVAEVVGVSKTTIFRHFKNKEDLLDAMHQRLFNQIKQILINLNTQKKEDTIKNTIRFFLDNSEYILFFVNCFIGPKDFEKKMGKEFKKQGFYTNYSIYDNDMNVKNKYVYVDIIYSVITTMFYIINYVKNGKFCEDKNKYFEFVTALILNGLNSLEEISDKRMEELKVYSEISKDFVFQEDKVFNAISEIMMEQGFSGVTVEAVANKLGLAKSSMYTYFSNKNAMLKQLSLNEISNLINCVQKNIKHGKNFSESIYIQLITEFNYLLKRESFLPVFVWLGSQGAFSDKDLIGDEIDFNLSVEFQDEKLLRGWTSVLCVALLTQGKKNKYTKEEFDNSIKKIYSLMSNGLKL